MIGGKNGEGKTSVLDAIAWALGGEKHRPTNAHREGSVLPPEIRVELSNGLVVERKGKNSSLCVTDLTGKRAGQALLDSFVEQFALDVPKFMAQGDKDKAKTLLKVIGIGDELEKMDAQEKDLYTSRTFVNRQLKEKSAYAAGLPEYSDVPEDYIDPAELVKKQQDILSQNAENARLRLDAQKMQIEYEAMHREREALYQRYLDMTQRLDVHKQKIAAANELLADAIDEPTDELEEQIASFAEINRKIRANKDKRRALEDLGAAENESNALTCAIEDIRRQRQALLQNADLPLEGLSVQDGMLLFDGKAWDCMSASQQLMVATAIVRKLKPQCGFVLLDKLEQLDTDTLRGFAKWLERENLQVIATRVDAGSEDCTIIIEDGRSIAPHFPEHNTELKKWKGLEKQ